MSASGARPNGNNRMSEIQQRTESWGTDTVQQLKYCLVYDKKAMQSPSLEVPNVRVQEMVGGCKEAQGQALSRERLSWDCGSVQQSISQVLAWSVSWSQVHYIWILTHLVPVCSLSASHQILQCPFFSPTSSLLEPPGSYEKQTITPDLTTVVNQNGTGQWETWALYFPSNSFQEWMKTWVCSRCWDTGTAMVLSANKAISTVLCLVQWTLYDQIFYNDLRCFFSGSSGLKTKLMQGWQETWSIFLLLVQRKQNGKGEAIETQVGRRLMPFNIMHRKAEHSWDRKHLLLLSVDVRCIFFSLAQEGLPQQKQGIRLGR